ncbi:MAG: hypothetical protein M0R28_18660 [Pigmentiphaga sp.]|nr:hypothetical protein [Pigmentiphaga sp.]
MKHWDAEAIRAGLSYPACIDAMREALRLTHDGAMAQPPRQITAFPDDAGMAFMPGALRGSPWIGAKAVLRLPAKEPGGRHRKAGVFMLFNAERAELVATFDANELTLRRTAATTVAATQALARPGPRLVGLLGTGQLAAAHLEAFATQADTQGFVLWGRSRDSAHRLAEAFGGSQPVTVMEHAADVAARADVLCTVSSASQPILDGAALRPGQHVNLVGSSTAIDHEVDASVATRGPVFVDDLEAARANAAELRAAVESGRFQWRDIAGTLGAVLAGEHPGRRSADDITIFKSLGLFAEDVLAARVLVGG